MAAEERPDDALEQGNRPAKPLLFLGGAALGAFLAAVPFAFADMPLSALTGWQIGVGAACVLTCATLTMLWGGRFVDAVMRALEGAGF
ncbi:MAG: hypothetical protein F6J97_20475 [Leptolyngbya sp. SIO4C1]|nr:hypothetical protein [Leptolyngbya sp. SIO4C1]